MKAESFTKQPEDFDSLIELLEYFDTELKCVSYFQNRCWENNVICPHCENEKIYKFSDGKRFKCASCKQIFTVKTGTIFEDSNLPLRKWFIAMYLATAHKKGISSHQLARDIKVTQKTAWFMLQRIRFQLGSIEETEQLVGIVEADETFVGGKNKNRHKDKKVAQCQGRAFKDKTPILGLMERQEVDYIERTHKVIKDRTVIEKHVLKPSKVRCFVVPNTKTASIQPIILNNVVTNSTFISDEWMGYNGLNKYYEHFVVDHGRGQYAIGDIHSNTIEGFWTWIKRAIIGIYHSVSRKHLQLYAYEAAFRYNTRNEKQGMRLSYILGNKQGKLFYSQLIQKQSL